MVLIVESTGIRPVPPRHERGWRASERKRQVTRMSRTLVRPRGSKYVYIRLIFLPFKQLSNYAANDSNQWRAYYRKLPNDGMRTVIQQKAVVVAKRTDGYELRTGVCTESKVRFPLIFNEFKHSFPIYYTTRPLSPGNLSSYCSSFRPIWSLHLFSLVLGCLLVVTSFFKSLLSCRLLLYTFHCCSWSSNKLPLTFTVHLPSFCL